MSPHDARPRSFTRAVVAMYGTAIAVSALSLLNVLVIARALGPVGRGDIAFLVTVATFTHYVVTLGVQESISNIAGRERESRPALATNSVGLAGILGLGAGVVLVGLVQLFPAVGGDASRRLLWASIASIPILVLGHFLRRIATAQYRFGVSNIAWLMPPALTASSNTIMWTAGVLTVGRALAVWIAAQVLATLFVAVFVATRLSGFGRPDVRLARRSVGFGLKTHGGAVMMMGNYRLDQWLLGSLAGSRELGLYSIAVAWTEALFHVGRALASVSRPDLVRATRERAVVLTAQVCRVALTVTLPLVVGMVVAAPWLCTSVFGEEFSGSIDDLRILALGALGVVALYVLGPALVAQGRPLLESGAIGMGFVVMLVANVVLIPRYEGLGAAIASTVSYSLTGATAAFFVSRGLGVRPVDLIPRPADAAFILQRLRKAAPRR